MKSEITLRLECLKRNFEYRKDYPKLKSFMDLSSGVHDGTEDIITPHDFAMKYSFNDPPFSQTIGAVFPFLDPYSERPEKDDILFDILKPQPVIPWNRKETPSHPKRYGWRQELEPHERLFMVDLRAKRKDIIADFEKRLTEIYQAEQWQEDRTRYVKEAFGALAVWDMRRQKRRFRLISLELKISENTAKKRFYRAFEITQNRRYDANLYRREAWTVERKEVSLPCEKCDQKETCSGFCPEALEIAMPYLEQDQITQKEKLLDKPDYIDSLKFSDNQ